MIESDQSYKDHDLLINYFIEKFNIKEDKEMVLKDIEREFLKIALKKQKDLTNNEKNLLREWTYLADQLGRENIPKSIEKEIIDIQVGDLIILQDVENKNIEDLVVMVNSDIKDDYFMGIPVVFDEALASNVSSIIEPEDNKKNTQLKDWTFALLNEIEAKFHISLVKHNGWLDKITSIHKKEIYNNYIKKRGRKVRNEFDSRAPQRAQIMNIVDYYKNLEPGKVQKKIKMFNPVNTMKALAG